MAKSRKAREAAGTGMPASAAARADHACSGVACHDARTGSSRPAAAADTAAASQRRSAPPESR